MDVHQASISIAVSDAAGKVLMECIIETKAATVLEFFQGLRGSLWVAFEEGTSAAWLYDLLKEEGIDPYFFAALFFANGEGILPARINAHLFLTASRIAFRPAALIMRLR
jgi:hypothetical protein